MKWYVIYKDTYDILLLKYRDANMNEVYHSNEIATYRMNSSGVAVQLHGEWHPCLIVKL